MSLNSLSNSRKTNNQYTKPKTDDEYYKAAMIENAKLIAKRAKFYNSKNWRTS